MAWKRERSWTADALCPLESDCAPVGESEQDLALPEALFPHGGSRRGCHAVLTALSPAGDYLRAQPVQGVYPNQRAPRGICCAEPIGCVHKKLQQWSCAILPFENLPSIPGAARVNIPAQVSAPRRVGPCWPLSTNSAGSQIKFLDVGAQAGQTAPAPANRKVSTTQNQISGNGIWM